MAINPIQPNIDNTKSQRPYREANGAIKTENFVHPLPAEGHLVHDTLLSVPKFWLKDIAYDMKAIKDGFQGKANDHQTGRLNDVGLKLGGIGIAAYLASKTADPRARLMEYVGLGAFLTSMSLYPLLAINAPSRIVQGYDIGKEYIDDQGRKKSVFQDPNYIPFDMYRGEYLGEDLDVIGDRMGIPRGIKNRDDLTKEQMRKIAIQNNTLWMMTAGFATPVMTALICCGLEKVLTPAMEMARNSRYNSKITNVLKLTNEMPIELDKIESNSLNEKVEKILEKYKDKELPKEEFDRLVKLISAETDDNIRNGVKEDLEKLFKSEKNGYLIPENFSKEFETIVKESFAGKDKALLEGIFKLSPSELEQALKNAGSSDAKYLTDEQIKNFKGELKKIYLSKINASNGYDKNALFMEQNRILENLSKSIKKAPSSYVSEDAIKSAADLAKIMGDFKSKEKVLGKCKSFKTAHDAETVLARAYGRFERTLLDVLDIKYKELRQMKESEQFTKEILEKKIEALVKDETKYEKSIKKLAKVMSDMDEALDGKAQDSHMKDLITAIENNYNNTAKRLSEAGNGRFAGTIDRLVKEDVKTLSNSLNSKEDLIKLLDGTSEKKNMEGLNSAYEYAKGVGSSKDREITNLVERYQGVRNSFNRILHTFDIYKRSPAGGEYWKNVESKIKNIMLEATSSNHTLKLNTINNPEYYKDITRTAWGSSLQESTERAIGEGQTLERFKGYINRFFNVMGSNDIDFTKPAHKVGDVSGYTHQSKTRMQKFNLVAQNPVNMVKDAAGRRFNNQKWLRAASMIGGTVLAGTILAQFCFGKIKNPHNIQKQVSDDTNS